MLGPSAGDDHFTFWLISTPKSKNELESVRLRTRGLVKHVGKFDIPSNLKVGTVDELYALSDDLLKIDLFIETSVKKISRQLRELLTEDQIKDHKSRTDTKAIFTVGNVNIESHMRSWEWNGAKYKSTNTSLRELTEAISSEISALDEELRGMQAEYTSMAHSLDAYERNKSGNLAVRDISDIVKENKKYYISSEHLTTLFVIVPRHSERDWDNTYETLSEGVVPRSSSTVFVDGELVLRNVVLFKTSLEEFKGKVSRKKWTAREYSSGEEGDQEEKEEKNDQQKEQKKQLKGDLIRWCRTNFSEAFSAWVHLKVIRVFVESVLRFGLPREYAVTIMEPEIKNEKKIRQVLEELYKSLGSDYLTGDIGDVVIPGTTEKFYPYVFTEIDLY